MVLPLTAEGAPSDCNAIVSMSQGRQVYNGQSGVGGPPASPLEASTGEEWMLLLKSGKTLKWWTTASNWGTLGALHRCGTDAEIDQIVFIFDPFGSGRNNDDGTTMRIHLSQVLAITAERYPNAVTDLVLIVGSNGHVVCPGPIRASQSHAARIGQMTMPEAGPDIDVPCSEYTSPSGSLSSAGAAEANSDLAAWFVATNG